MSRERSRYGTRKEECTCGKKARPGQRKCNECHAAYMRLNRKRHGELNPEQKKKSIARAYVNTYVKRGAVQKTPCVVCGNEKSEAHHEDYDKPLEVVWYCREHHLELHENRKHENINFTP